MTHELRRTNIPFYSSLVVVFLLICFFRFADAEPSNEIFGISADLSKSAQGGAILSVAVIIPEDHYLYADLFDVEVRDPAEITLVSGPEPERLVDDSTGSESIVYARDFVMEFSASNVVDDSLFVAVSYQGCRKGECFLPCARTFALTVGGGGGETGFGEVAVDSDIGDEALSELLSGFELVAGTAGYMTAGDFLDFLDLSDSPRRKTGVMAMLAHGSIWLSLLGIILGGLSLNLTPCVLPMIPVNIAIIGAGVRSASRLRGFVLGGFYGLGMAVAYGTLGLVVVLTGSMFGALNASPWFNIGIAILFLVLALAMFGVFSIDFSRFLGTAEGREGRGIIAVFLMGMVSALLAGACVAPVVIFVLLHSAGLYAGGSSFGLLLPFLLGVGMALPWPFLGAGLSVLPKPGRWMVRVKILFGMIILAAAVYYAFEGARILARDRAVGFVGRSDESDDAGDIWITSLPAGLIQAREKNMPVLIDFRASWCKSCQAMDATTFKNSAVRARLSDFVAVKYAVEAPEQLRHKRVLDLFGVRGLPTYVILVPKPTEED